MTYTIKEIEKLNSEILNLFSNGTVYKKIDSSVLIGKLVFFISKAGLPKEFISNCDSIKNLELLPAVNFIVFSDYPTIGFQYDHTNKCYIPGKNHLAQIERAEKLLTLKSKINSGEILLIHTGGIDINLSINESTEILNSKEVLEEETFNSINMMLQSRDKEIFNIGWKTLWQYDYTKNKIAILALVKGCNPRTRRLRTKQSNIEFCFKQFKKLWPNYNS